MTFLSSKRSLRATYLSARKNLPKRIVLEKSNLIYKKVVSLDIFKDGENICAYLPINNEVETRNLIDFLTGADNRFPRPEGRGSLIFAQNSLHPRLESRGFFAQNKVFLPKFTGQKWAFSQFKSWKDLEKGPFGILQPKGLIESKIDFDIAILPGVAFDKSGTRLGYGKGVFDKLLHKSKAIKIGLCFDFQFTDSLPRKKHDLIVNMVVTEKRILELKN